jgi:hypothetical protein
MRVMGNMKRSNVRKQYVQESQTRFTYHFGRRLTDGLLTVAQIKGTQKAIKHVLTERHYAWQDAYKAAKSDREIKFDPKDGEAEYLGSIVEVCDSAFHLLAKN